MSSVVKPQSRSDKSEQRRQQVLDAATECFRREGYRINAMIRFVQGGSQ